MCTIIHLPLETLPLVNWVSKSAKDHSPEIHHSGGLRDRPILAGRLPGQGFPSPPLFLKEARSVWGRVGVVEVMAGSNLEDSDPGLSNQGKMFSSRSSMCTWKSDVVIQLMKNTIVPSNRLGGLGDKQILAGSSARAGFPPGSIVSYGSQVHVSCACNYAQNGVQGSHHDVCFGP